MGMYTSIRSKVVVLPEWREALAYLHERCDDTFWRSGSKWRRVFNRYPDMPGLADWVKVGRRDFIPFGVLAFDPGDGFCGRGKSFSEFDKDDGVWEFCCSLKNYDGEIEQFASTVLAAITQSVDWFETVSEWAHFDDERPWQEKAIKYLTERTQP